MDLNSKLLLLLIFTCIGLIHFVNSTPYLVRIYGEDYETYESDTGDCGLDYFIAVKDTNSSETITGPMANTFVENGTYTYRLFISSPNHGGVVVQYAFSNSIGEQLKVNVTTRNCTVLQPQSSYIFVPPERIDIVSYFKVFHYYIDFGDILWEAPQTQCVTNNSAYLCFPDIYSYLDRGYHFIGKLYTIPNQIPPGLYEYIQVNVTIGTQFSHSFVTTPIYNNITEPVTELIWFNQYPPTGSAINGVYPEYIFTVLSYSNLKNVNQYTNLRDGLMERASIVHGTFDNVIVESILPAPLGQYQEQLFLIQNDRGVSLFSQNIGYSIIKYLTYTDKSLVSLELPQIVIGQISSTTLDNFFGQYTINSDGIVMLASPYPFGYSRNTYNTSIQYKASTYLPLPGSKKMRYYMQEAQIQLVNTNFNQAGENTTKAIITTLEYLPSTPYSFIVKMGVKSPSGLRYINFADAIYMMDHLVSGDIYDGVYVFEHFTPWDQVYKFRQPNIYLASNNDITSSYLFIYHTNTLLPVLPVASNCKIFPSNLTKIEFVPHIIDTSYGPVNVTLYFKLANEDVHFKPILYYTFKIMVVIFNTVCYYSPNDQMHRCDITIPQYVGNFTMSYSLGESLLLDRYTIFGEKSDLYIYSNFIDLMPPLVVDIEPLPSNIVTVDAVNGATIGFELVVEDYPSGLKYGELNITSDYDLHPRTFKFNQSTLVNATTGTYRFEFPVNGKCRNQTFSISGMKLIENGGWVSQRPDIPPSVDPMIKVIYNNTFQTNITIICNDLGDTELPTIVYFSCNITNITYNSNANGTPVQFDITVTDNLELSDRHSPNVYLWDSTGKTVMFYVNKKIAVNSSYVNYTLTGVIPYEFGFQGSLISVYGLVDSNLNIGGYTSLELQGLGFPYFINTIVDMPNVAPWINSSNALYESGGQVTLKGRGFGESTTAFIDYGQGFVPTQVVYVQEVIAVITVNATNRPFILVKLGNSNVYNIPVQSIPRSVINPPVDPILCPSTCEAGGRGTCSPNGCVCNSPWFGPTCSDKTIKVPDPVFNPNNPTIVITPPDNSSSVEESAIYCIISIYAVRELDLNGDIIHEYKFQNWTYSNQTKDTDTNFKYLYNTKLQQDRDTQFNVTIQWFREQANISFANQIDTIAPYTLKFSMDVDHYDFASFYNTFQIIMEVGIRPRTKFCTQSKSSGQDSNNNVQWLKLQIDDKSLYGVFNRRGVVDGRVLIVTNSILDSKFMSNLETSYIGINVPYFVRGAQLDPNFATLISDSKETSTAQCNEEEESKSNKNSLIVGIVVGCGAAIAIAVAAIIYIKKKREESAFYNSYQEKLKKLNSQ